MHDTILKQAIEQLTDELEDSINNDPNSAKAFIGALNKIFNNPLMKSGNCFIIAMTRKGLSLSHTKASHLDIARKPLTVSLQPILDSLENKANEIIEEND